MEIRIRKLHYNEDTEFVRLVAVFKEVFAMKASVFPSRKHLRDLLRQENFLVFAAYNEDNEVVAGLTAYTLTQYYSPNPQVYIYDLAVRASFQRKGIGSKLIAAITDYCRQSGVEEIFVQADKGDEHALKFYQSTGARMEEVVHFYYTLNEGK